MKKCPSKFKISVILQSSTGKGVAFLIIPYFISASTSALNSAFKFSASAK